MFGLIARLGTFAINVGLVFLLSQQAPQLGWWNAHPKSTVFEKYRDSILAGLDRVRADLETNGKLLFSTRRVTTPPLTRESQAQQLDQRVPRVVHVRD